MKTLFFLSGLPRSGSTVLGSILNQNPLIYTSPTSPLNELLCHIDSKLYELNIQYNFDMENVSHNIYHGVIKNFYNHIDRPYVIDKHRSWPQNINSILNFITQKPKIIVTYRSIPEILASYITLIDKNKDENNFIDALLTKNNIEITTNNRVDLIWRKCISPSYSSVVNGLNNFSNFIYLMNYDNLIESPDEEMKNIYNFLEVDSFKHDFKNISNTCGQEKDEKWGLKNLHLVRPLLKKESKNPIDIIGKENTKIYSKLNLNNFI